MSFTEPLPAGFRFVACLTCGLPVVNDQQFLDAHDQWHAQKVISAVSFVAVGVNDLPLSDVLAAQLADGSHALSSSFVIGGARRALMWERQSTSPETEATP